MHSIISIVKAFKAFGLLSCNTPRFPDREGKSCVENLIVDRYLAYGMWHTSKRSNGSNKQ
jgi:hypothetical protein